jgi:phospholipase/carboxylesterase
VLTAGAPLAEARAAVIMVHGRGAGAANILDIVPAITRPHVAFLAPGANGGTWYPNGFMAPIETNEPGISSGIAVIHGLIDRALESGIPGKHIVLLGFSQGACLCSTAAQRRPQRYGGVIVYSGGLIGPPGTDWEVHGGFARTPAFFGCSDIDGHVPETRVRESAALFEAMGAEVTTRIYPGMGHLVNEDELAFTRDLLTRIAG